MGEGAERSGPRAPLQGTAWDPQFILSDRRADSTQHTQLRYRHARFEGERHVYHIELMILESCR